MFKKGILAAAVVALGAFTASAGEMLRSDVNGTTFYKMPSGELVTRNLVLSVPGEGEDGKVSLKYGEHEVEAHAVKVKKKMGQVIVAMVFLNVPGAPENTALGLVGSYIKATNAVVYYGDTYFRALGGHDLEASAESLLSSKGHHDECDHGDDDHGDHDGGHGRHGHGWHYAGGFNFNKPLALN